MERVKYLEEKQEELDKNTISVYKYNYSSAVLNLASMQREIKPLTLFNSSRQFYSTLDQVSNPMNYEGYQEWFGEFKKFVEQEKDARLSAVSHILNLKIRFGTITFRILENLNKYESLIKKYEDDQYLKPKVAKLKSKLDLVRNSFKSTFNPQDYIKASNEMYVVE